MLIELTLQTLESLLIIKALDVTIVSLTSKCSRNEGILFFSNLCLLHYLLVMLLFLLLGLITHREAQLRNSETLANKATDNLQSASSGNYVLLIALKSLAFCSLSNMRSEPNSTSCHQLEVSEMTTERFRNI